MKRPEEKRHKGGSDLGVARIARLKKMVRDRDAEMRQLRCQVDEQRRNLTEICGMPGFGSYSWIVRLGGKIFPKGTLRRRLINWLRRVEDEPVPSDTATSKRVRPTRSILKSEEFRMKADRHDVEKKLEHIKAELLSDINDE